MKACSALCAQRMLSLPYNTACFFGLLINYAGAAMLKLGLSSFSFACPHYLPGSCTKELSCRCRWQHAGRHQDTAKREAQLTGNWRSAVRRFTDTHGQGILRQLDISIIVEREKARYISNYLSDHEHSSLQLYRSVHPDYQYAKCLSSVKCYPYRKLISRFRCGCHGLHVDTGRFGRGEEARSREERLCPVCLSCSVEDEHHFLFDCPAYCHTHDQHSNLFQHSSLTVASFLATSQPGLLGSYLRKCFSRRHFVLTSLPITLLSCLRTWAQKHRIALIQRDAALLAWLLVAPFECIGLD